MSSAGGSTNPILMPEDIKFYYSGGYFNSEAKNSIGGETSSFQLVSGTLNGLFDRVDTIEASEGDVEYRCIYLRNTSQTRKLLNTRIWIETGTASADTSIAISIGAGGINGTEALLPGEGTEPPMNFFSIPLQEPDEPNIGDLYPGDHIGLWVRWVIQPGTTSIANDFAVIRIDGEREPESIVEPLPDTDPPGTTPPPSTEGCPPGSKWSPVEARCVDDSTVIICPNGYTYNQTTQRCVPPTTPPPSVPNWTFAAVGDFSCSSDAEETFELLNARLNKTNSADTSVFLALGDFSYEDGDQSCWIDMTQTLTNIYPNHIAPVFGNHDDSEDGDASDRTDIINEYPLVTSQGYYTFTRRNIRFIMLDTQTNYNSGSAQHSFVTTALQQAQADPAIKWKVVCYHKPSLVSDTNYGPLTDFRDTYHALFDQYKVDLILNGHNHNYFRSKPVRHNTSTPATPTIAVDQAAGEYINIDGRIFATVGTGGRSSHPEFDGNAEAYVGDRHSPEPYGALFITLQDNGNKLACQFIGNDNVVIDDFTLSKPAATPPPSIVCPQGFHYSETQGRCIISPTTCPTLYRWEPAQNKCVPISGTPPPTNVDPLLGVEWYYDSTATQNTPQTINAGSYDTTEGIVLCSADEGVTSTVIQNGYIHVKSGPGTGGNQFSTGGIYFDYWKRSRWSQTGDSSRAKFNTAFLMTFIFENQELIRVTDGNNPSLGFSPNTTFGGFSIGLTGSVPSPNGNTDSSNSQVKYATNSTNFNLGNFGEQVLYAFPSGRTLENGKTYKLFYTVRTNRVNQTVVLNAWLDFGDGSGWVKIQTDTTYSSSNWNPNPAQVQSGRLDTSQILQGPSFIERYHLGIRNIYNQTDVSKPDLRIKDVKIGTLPFLPEGTNPPPGGTDPPPGGGGGTGGTVDSNGIRWFWATGQQGVINQTRNESSDDRWSGNVSNVSQYGYECTMYLTIPNIASGGHFAMKSWGPNHSGDCGYEEGGDCCCWYDLGVRSNGDIQQEIERPHPSNDSFNKGKVIQNIGRGLQGQTTGLKWVIHPQTPGGSADNGGIKIQMWVDTSGLSNGRPQNQWRKAMDLVDTGDILGDYPNPNFEHDLEVRNSDSSGQTSYAGGLHWRKITATDTDQSNTTGGGTGGGGTGGGGETGGGGTGGGGTQPPPGSGSLVRLLSWGDNDTTADAEDVLDQMFTETNVSTYLFAGDGPYSEDSSDWIDMMENYFNTPTLKDRLMLAQGNHEHPESESQQSENQIEAWKPGLHNSNEGLEWLTSKKVGNVFIIVMNSQDDNIDQVGGAQYNWVQQRLNEAVSLRGQGQIDWIVTMVHKSWFNLLGSNPAYVTARHAYATMFRQAQVDFMFHGHNHSYAIWKPIVDPAGGNNDENTASTAVFTMSGSNYNFAVDHGTVYIINGNGGHEINGWGEDPGDFPNISYANDTEYGYTVLDINGKTATLRAKSVNGTVRHTMTFVR